MWRSLQKIYISSQLFFCLILITIVCLPKGEMELDALNNQVCVYFSKRGGEVVI